MAGVKEAKDIQVGEKIWIAGNFCIVDEVIDQNETVAIISKQADYPAILLKNDLISYI